MTSNLFILLDRMPFLYFLYGKKYDLCIHMDIQVILDRSQDFSP